MRIVIAIGGNAMTAADGQATPEGQRAAIRSAAEPVAELVATGHEVLLTHGNGPQVGNLLVKNELAAEVVPPIGLDWCGAQTQGTIGMLMLNALDDAFNARGIERPVAALVSRTLVDADDPGFTRPTKPIGRFLTREEAAPLMAHGQTFIQVPGRGWRRVVASPVPRECLDSTSAESLMDSGFVVVCSGGGGIPTIRDPSGEYRGVEAVIDKDLTAALIATQVRADLLVIATDVDAVVTDWGTERARPVNEVTAAQMRQIAEEQQFAPGSMGPKVEAVTSFAETGQGTGVITSLTTIGAAVAGLAGTRVVPIPQANLTG